MQRLLILGAGGFGFATAEVASLLGFESIVFLDDSWPAKALIGVWPIIGKLSDFSDICTEADVAVVAIGNNATRGSWLSALQAAKVSLTNVVHPSASISPSAHIDQGCIIMANVAIGANSSVGFGAIINASTVLDHDVHLHNFVHLGVGCAISGGTVIESSAWLQAGCSVSNCSRIKANTILLAGSAVVN